MKEQMCRSFINALSESRRVWRSAQCQRGIGTKPRIMILAPQIGMRIILWCQHRRKFHSPWVQSCIQSVTCSFGIVRLGFSDHLCLLLQLLPNSSQSGFIHMSAVWPNCYLLFPFANLFIVYLGFFICLSLNLLSKYISAELQLLLFLFLNAPQPILKSASLNSQFISGWFGTSFKQSSVIIFVNPLIPFQFPPQETPAP